MEIGGVQLKSNLLFAPIASFSNVAFRHICSEFGAGLTFTELVSAKGLVYGNKGTEPLIATLDAPSAVQLFGHEPEFLYKAAKDERLAKFSIIDLNAGCPVRKVFSSGDGSALMLNPTLLSECVQALKEGGKRPVTVKMRAGVEMGKPTALECALAAEKGGADAITVHARYREQFYSGNADHYITKEVKEAVHIPVIANGDIVDFKSFERVKDITHADGFMIGRAALSKPYIFKELLGEDYVYDRKKTAIENVEILRKYLPDRVVANMMKLQLCYYMKGESSAKAVRVAAGQAKCIEEIYQIIEDFL